ncbi:hypothetical protein [Cupriavidus basilensis]|uniref:hypothetical protein n=1 Tax=Cupriavidus basilensis TaxID=68895 RepID=UPI0039F69A73
MNWGVLALSVLACLVTGYAATAAWAAWRPPAASHDSESTGLRLVSVLKPLCCADPQLDDNLDGLCRQQHPVFQLVFGVRAADDAAIAVVERLRADFPDWGCKPEPPKIPSADLHAAGQNERAFHLASFRGRSMILEECLEHFIDALIRVVSQEFLEIYFHSQTYDNLPLQSPLDFSLPVKIAFHHRNEA